jgi:hypothetical protein
MIDGVLTSHRSPQYLMVELILLKPFLGIRNNNDIVVITVLNLSLILIDYKSVLRGTVQYESSTGELSLVGGRRGQAPSF